MIYTEKTRVAMILTELMHRGQYDKGGFPYISHPLYLANKAISEDATILALLHDTIEDRRFISHTEIYNLTSNNDKDTDTVSYINTYLSNAYSTGNIDDAIDTICRKFEFSSEVSDAWRLLTHRKDIDTYDQYITKLKSNKLATEVKLLDLEHNLITARLLGSKPKQSLIDRYNRAIKTLTN